MRAALVITLALLYYHVDVMRYITDPAPAYLPFNARDGVHAVITFLCYKPVSRMVKDN